MNKHKHVKRDVGLAAVFGAFALAFVATYPAATMSAQLTADSVTAIYAEQSRDLNNDGMADALQMAKTSDERAMEAEGEVK